MTKRQTKPKAPARLTYTVLRDGYVAGRPRKKGDVIEITPAEAKYENLSPAGKAVEAAGKGSGAT